MNDYPISSLDIFTGMFVLIYFLISALMIVSMWKIFVKAGKPGWTCLVPVYNVVIMLEITKMPIWYILLTLIPFVNFIILIIILINLAKVFNKSTGFILGMIFLPLIFYPILAFGGAEYIYSEKVGNLDQPDSDLVNNVYNDPRFDPPVKKPETIVNDTENNSGNTPPVV